METSNQTIFTRPYFLSKNEAVEDNYILFRKIDMTHHLRGDMDPASVL